jgi:N-acetylmuramoyl-L-alanine amidase
MQSIIKYISIQTKTIGIVVLSALLFFSVAIYARTPEGYRIKKVVIDAGHGGKDSGARGKNSLEKDITLAVALKVGEYIGNHFSDVEVIYTRKEDVFVGLDERTKIANESGADLFISIHCNANPSKVPFGTETYVMGLHKSDENLDVAMRENAVITYEEDYTTKYEGYDPNSAESFIIFNLMQHSFLDQSLNMASLVQDEFRDRAKRKDRGVKQAGFLVLWRASMPSVLVELGFLSNLKEEEFLVTESGQDYLASAIFRAFRDYKNKIESRSAFTAETYFDSSIKTSTDNASAPKITTTWTDYTLEYKSVVLEKGLLFKVQITASSKQIPTNSTFFKNVDGVEEYNADGIYKYLVGSKKSYSDALDFNKQIRELFPDAFIVAFLDGKQIPLSQAINR